MKKLPAPRPYVQVFVDLLGLSSALLQLDRLSDPGAKKSEKQAAFDRSIGQIVKFRELIESVSEVQAPPVDDLGELSAEHRELYLESFNHQSTYRWFSDCCVITIPYASQRPDQMLNGLYRLCIYVSAMSVFMLSEGQLLRGGMEIGNGVEVEPGEVLSSALAKAYDLESRSAIHPRVVVGPHLESVLRGDELLNPKQARLEVSQSLRAEVLGMLKREETSEEPHLDFLCPHVPSRFSQIPGGDAFLTKAVAAVREYTESPPQDHTEKEHAKWEWLKRYMQDSGVWIDA